MIKKTKQKKGVYLVFDLDGVLVPAGIGILNKKKALKKYFNENKVLIKEFRKKLSFFRKKGFGLAINTGRDLSFARKIEREMFPSRRADFIECELGIVNITKTTTKNKVVAVKRLSKAINRNNLNILNKNKKLICDFAIDVLGAKIEKKDVMITIALNKLKDIDKNYTKVQRFLKKIKIFKYLDVILGAVAIDIVPKGINKLGGLKRIMLKNDIIYFGDSFSDEVVIKRAIISVAPFNASTTTKKKVKMNPLGILPKRAELKGVMEALTAIENSYKKDLN